MPYASATFAPSGYAAPVQIAVVAAMTEALGVRAERDRRWPIIVRKLATLRARNRRSIRIVDANCGSGEVLLGAVRKARALGFVAIEGRGIDPDPQRIGQARKLAAMARDPAIGLDFAVGDAATALRDEAEFPADIVLYAGPIPPDSAVAKLARGAGHVVLGSLRVAA